MLLVQIVASPLKPYICKAALKLYYLENPVLKRLHWLLISQQIIFKLMLIVHQALTGLGFPLTTTRCYGAFSSYNQEHRGEPLLFFNKCTEFFLHASHNTWDQWLYVPSEKCLALKDTSVTAVRNCLQMTTKI